MRSRRYFGVFTVVKAEALQPGLLLVRGLVAGLLSILLLTLSFAHSVQAAPGDLDLSFDSDGLVTTDFSGSGSSDQANAIAIQSDKIVVAGFSNANGSDDFALARYNSDGTLDNTFDTDGLVTTDFSGSGSSDQANAIAIQSDKIVVAGSSKVGGKIDFALARYNSNGSLDTTFGSGGLVTTDFGGNRRDQANAIAI